MPFRVRAGARLVFLLLIWIPCFGVGEPKQMNPRDQAWQVLRAGLVDSKVANRKEAVEALSLISNNRTVQKLAERALQDAHPTVRTYFHYVMNDRGAQVARLFGCHLDVVNSDVREPM